MTTIALNENAVVDYLQTRASHLFTPTEILTMLRQLSLTSTYTTKVQGSNGNTYVVDLKERTCTCPHFTYGNKKCKHLKSTLAKNPTVQQVAVEKESESHFSCTSETPVKVSGSAGQTYLLCLEAKTCTCPYFTNTNQECKHLRKLTASTSTTQCSTRYFPDKDAPTTIAISGSNGQVYWVCLDTDTCTCPYFAKTNTMCDHLKSCYVE